MRRDIQEMAAAELQRVRITGLFEVCPFIPRLYFCLYNKKNITR